MFVVGLILQHPHATPVEANAALVRDIVSYLALLMLLIPVFQHGLTLALVICMGAFYVALTRAHPPCVWF